MLMHNRRLKMKKADRQGFTTILYCAFVLLFSNQAVGVELSPFKKSNKQEWFKVAQNVYVFRYTFYFTLFVKTDKGVVAFDPLSNEAALSYAKAIKQALPGAPLRAIVYSHWHTDHSKGAGVLRNVFGKNIPIVAHARTKKRLIKLGDKDVPIPTLTVSDEGMLIKDQVSPIELRYAGFAHTDTMLIAFLPKQKLLFAVDFVNNDSMGWRTLPGVDFNELINMQRRLLKLDFKIITFGHGRPGDRKVVDRQIGYYSNLLIEARRAIKKGLTEDEAAKQLSLPQYKSWNNYDSWFKLNFRGAYRFEKQRMKNNKK